MGLTGNPRVCVHVHACIRHLKARATVRGMGPHAPLLLDFVSLGFVPESGAGAGAASSSSAGLELEDLSTLDKSSTLGYTLALTLG